ncbi:MAG TPA: sulfotransferase [Saprospiraceae bacterium]|nr:sulfotransferase [Saprospiraceae bacterium]
MALMIGGAPSTGSSLLRQILNRHSNIYCGPETRLLSIRELYLNWGNSKNRLFRKGPLGVRPNAWHNITGILCTGVELYPNQKQVKELVKNTHSFESFISSFFKELLEKNNKHYWAEKTPNNVYCIDEFLSSFPLGKVIVTIRDPLEIICSLLDKGNSLFAALSHTLIHLSLAAGYEKSDRLFILPYEHLIENPENTIRKICLFIDQPYEPGMLLPQKHRKVQGKTKLQGWRHSETEKVTVPKSKRFDQLNQNLQKELITAMQMLVFSPSLMKTERKPSAHFSALYDELPYVAPNWTSQNPIKILQQLQLEKRKDQAYRLKKLQLKFLNHYPIQLTKHMFS